MLTAEKRSVTGNLDKTIRDYLEGPIDNNLTSPFPVGVSLNALSLDGPCLKLDLSDEFSMLAGIDLTIACSALAQTCFGLCDAEEIHISANGKLLDGKAIIIIKNDTILTVDNDTVSKEVP